MPQPMQLDSARMMSGLNAGSITIQRLRCHYSGRVQGVGFRYTAKNLAMQFAVGGCVRNLPDGRVELIIEGSPTEVDQVLQGIARKMSGFIRKVDCVAEPATGDTHHFAIGH